MLTETHSPANASLPPLVNKELSSLLAGFEIVPADGVPFITLDKYRRFYLNTAARKLINVKPYERVALFYDATERALAIAKPSALSGEYARMAQYNVDRRYYMSARKFTRNFPYPPEQAPYEFMYDRGSSDGDVFIFRLDSPRS